MADNGKQAQNRAYIDGFLTYLKDVQGYSEKTVISYAHDLGRLEDFLSSHDLAVSEMVYEDAREFTSDLYDQDLSHATINRILSDFGAYVDEQHITTAYDVRRGKPNPDPYLVGLAKAGGLQPWQAVVIENAPLGIRAGVAARIFTIGVNTGPLPNDLLLQSGAHLLFPSMTDLSDAWKHLDFNQLL